MKVLKVLIKIFLVLGLYTALATIIYTFFFAPGLPNKGGSTNSPLFGIWLALCILSCMIWWFGNLKCSNVTNVWPFSWIPGAAATNMLAAVFYSPSHVGSIPNLPEILLAFSVLLLLVQGLIILYAGIRIWRSTPA